MEQPMDEEPTQTDDDFNRRDVSETVQPVEREAANPPALTSRTPPDVGRRPRGKRFGFAD